MRGLMNSWRADLGVGEAVAGQPGDLGLLGGELVAASRRCACGRVSPVAEQLALGALGERLDAHRGEHLVGGAQLLARVQAAALAAQPFAVEQMGAGELHADAGAAEPLDRLAVEALGGRRPR